MCLSSALLPLINNKKKTTSKIIYIIYLYCMNLHLAQLDAQLQLLINSKQIEKKAIIKNILFHVFINIKTGTKYSLNTVR